MEIIFLCWLLNHISFGWWDNQGFCPKIYNKNGSLIFNILIIAQPTWLVIVLQLLIWYVFEPPHERYNDLFISYGCVLCVERDKEQDKEASFYKPNIDYTFFKVVSQWWNWNLLHTLLSLFPHLPFNFWNVHCFFEYLVKLSSPSLLGYIAWYL